MSTEVQRSEAVADRSKRTKETKPRMTERRLVELRLQSFNAGRIEGYDKGYDDGCQAMQVSGTSRAEANANMLLGFAGGLLAYWLVPPAWRWVVGLFS